MRRRTVTQCLHMPTDPTVKEPTVGSVLNAGDPPEREAAKSTDPDLKRQVHIGALAVVDNLSEIPPVTAQELEAIEVYLAAELAQVLDGDADLPIGPQQDDTDGH